MLKLYLENKKKITETKSVIVLQSTEIHMSNWHPFQVIQVLYDYIYLLKIKPALSY